MLAKSSLVLCIVLPLAACGSKQSDPAAPTPVAPATSAETPAEVVPSKRSLEEDQKLFQIALAEFANKGGADRYESILSARMRKRYEERSSALTPEKQKMLSEMAVQLQLPADASVRDVGAAIWQQGLAPFADKLATTKMQIVAEEDRQYAVFPELKGKDGLRIRVAHEEGEGGGYKIDEN